MSSPGCPRGLRRGVFSLNAYVRDGALFPFWPFHFFSPGYNGKPPFPPSPILQKVLNPPPRQLFLGPCPAVQARFCGMLESLSDHRLRFSIRLNQIKHFAAAGPCQARRLYIPFSSQIFGDVVLCNLRPYPRRAICFSTGCSPRQYQCDIFYLDFRRTLNVIVVQPSR